MPHPFSANQITWSKLLIQIHILNGKQCRFRSVGFFRSQLIWIYTVCKARVYPGSAGQGLRSICDKSGTFFLLFLHKVIWCGSSLKVPRPGTSNEYTQYMFLWRTGKIIPELSSKVLWQPWPTCTSTRSNEGLPHLVTVILLQKVSTEDKDPDQTVLMRIMVWLFISHVA